MLSCTIFAMKVTAFCCQSRTGVHHSIGSPIQPSRTNPVAGGYEFFFRVRSAVHPVPVIIPGDLESSLTSALIPALEHAIANSTHPIKGLMLANPHNPLGQCYPRAVLEQCLRFCQEQKIHFISDEVFGLSVFSSPDLPNPVPFTSVMSLDTDKTGCELSRVHVIWSMSKDFGSSGLRLVGVPTAH